MAQTYLKLDQALHWENRSTQSKPKEGKHDFDEYDVNEKLSEFCTGVWC